MLKKPDDFKVGAIIHPRGKMFGMHEAVVLLEAPNKLFHGQAWRAQALTTGMIFSATQETHAICQFCNYGGDYSLDSKPILGYPAEKRQGVQYGESRGLGKSGRFKCSGSKMCSNNTVER